MNARTGIRVRISVHMRPEGKEPDEKMTRTGPPTLCRLFLLVRIEGVVTRRNMAGGRKGGGGEAVEVSARGGNHPQGNALFIVAGRPSAKGRNATSSQKEQVIEEKRKGNTEHVHKSSRRGNNGDIVGRQARSKLPATSDGSPVAPEATLASTIYVVLLSAPAPKTPGSRP